jgi:predicted HAD superfamily phosphohydrolase YqeG
MVTAGVVVATYLAGKPGGDEQDGADQPAARHRTSPRKPRRPRLSQQTSVPAEGRDPVTSRYVRITGLPDLFTEARELSVQTMIFDVEPLVAPWHGSQESLDQGIARILRDARMVPSVRVVVFATNSARRPSVVPAVDGLQVRYLASAAKPLRTAPYHGLPGPGAVAGDQLPTDGMLACRLGFAFLHYVPELAGVLLGPALMHRWGQLVRPVLFRRPAAGR